MSREPVLVLLVEDNEDHAELLKRTLQGVDQFIRVVHARDGETALDYLGLSRPVADAEKPPRPQLVLLDLRLPRIDGLDVLRKIKEAVSLRPIPVIILTTSSAAPDVARAYALHANSYLTKPGSFETFSKMMEDVTHYWTGWNATPRTQA